MSYVTAKAKHFIYTLIQLAVAPKLLMLASFSFFHLNLHTFVIILVYELLKNDLFYMEKIALQNNVNFPRDAKIYSERTELRGKFRKNRNIEIENPSFLQCKAADEKEEAVEEIGLKGEAEG